MKVFLLINPAASGGKARQVGEQAYAMLRQRGADVVRAESLSASDLTEKARSALGLGVERVLVVGGDGTWHYALNGLAHSGLPIALIPCGRGNDFRRYADLPNDTAEAVDVALNGRIKPLDLVWTGLRHYIGVGGVGFDSEVTECANTKVPLLAGTLAYTVAVFYKLFAFKPKTVRIVHDHGVFEGLIMFAVFGNSKYYGGGMKIAPHAEMDDGLMDVLIIRKVGIPTLLATLPKVFSGTHIPHPDILTLRTTRAEITTPDRMDLYGDGEYIQPVPVVLEVKPGALHVVLRK